MAETELLPCPWCNNRLHKGLGFWCHMDRTCVGADIIVTDTPERIAAWNRRSPPQVGRGMEDAARIISEATAKKLAERIRLLGSGSREERSQADLGERGNQ